MNRKKIYNAFSLYALIFILMAIWFYFSSSFVFANETDSKEVSGQVKTEEMQEPEVFEEPEKYNIQSMNLKTSEVATVESGGSAGNELFDFEAFIKEADITDGTAPFDKDNQVGNDSSANNGIVRTFDTVTYPIKVTINPKKADKLNNIVLKITGTLENGISGKQVNAKFSVGGYENITSGVVGFEQLYTIEQTGNSIMVPINLDIKGAKNGEIITPKFKVEVVSVDGTDITKENISMNFDKLPSVKTSGKVNIKPYVATGLAGQGIPYYPYSGMTGNPDDIENIQSFSVSFGLQNLDGKSDNRGATFPTGEIKYSLNLSAYVYWDGGKDKGKNVQLDFNGQDTPLYLYDQREISSKNPLIGSKNTLSEGNQYSFNYAYNYSAPLSKMANLNQATIDSQSFRSVWDSGEWNVTKPTLSSKYVNYTGVNKNYVVGNTFPEYRADGYTGSKIYGVNDKIFSSNSFIIKMPNEYTIGGKNNPEGYANNVYYVADATLDSYVDESGKEVKVNKTKTATFSERNNPEGSYSVQTTFYSYPSSKQLGTPNIGWGEVSKGDISTILGNDIRYIASLGSSVVSYGGYDALFRWNTDAFELTEAYAKEADKQIYSWGYYDTSLKKISNNREKQKIYYGIAKFTDNSFDNFTTKGKNDYDWYETYSEASKNGNVGAIKSSILTATGPKWTSTGYFPLHVKTKKIGSFNDKGTANIILTNYYPYSDRERTKEIDVYKNKTYNTPSIWSEDGQLITKQAPVGGSINFETLAILNAEVSSNITADKPTYYNSEIVNWTVKSSIVLPPNGAPEGFDGSVEVQQTLPKGLDYKVGSGKQGTISKEPKSVKNTDGTTTLTWELLVSKDSLIEDVTFSTSINPFALSIGVQSSLTVKNVISSPLDTRRDNLRTSTQTINILKVGMVGIYENIDKQDGEKNSAFSISLQPYTTIEEEQDVKGITILPQNKDKLGSSFSGSALLKKITISGKNPVSIYLNNNVVETSDPHKVNLNAGGWYKYTGSGQNISNAKTVLFHVEGVLANTDMVGIKLDIQTNNNNFGDKYLNETTINSATDYKLSPISNRVRYTIKADVELSLERIQIYTANHKKGLPVKIRINKDIYRKDSINEKLKLVVYQKDTNKKVTEKTYTVNDLLKENEMIIPTNVLEKGESNNYEVRIEGYNTDRLYALEGKNKIDTLGYTATEKKLEATVSSEETSQQKLEYSGVIMTEREIDKDILEYYETLSIPLVVTEPVKSGYGFEMKQLISYKNELNVLNGVKAQFVVDSKLIDSNLEYLKVGNNSTIELLSSEETVKGNTMEQTMILPKVFVEDKTGFLYSEDQILGGDSRIKYEVKDGGNKLYTPIWIEELGSYKSKFESVEPFGINEISFSVSDTIDINAYMYATIGSETIQEDELLIQPIYPDSTKPKNWSKEELKWLIK